MEVPVGTGPAPEAVPSFPEQSSVGPRDWGEEILLVLAPGKYIGKLLKMNAGSGGGLQRHHRKDEAAHVLSGEYQFTYADKSGKLQTRVLTTGQTVHIPPGCVHQGVALTDCVIVEFSTPHFDDRVRVETDYGQPATDGLPSTKLEDVKTR